MKMTFLSLLVVIQIVRAYSTSKIFIHDGNEPLRTAAVNIAEQCFGSGSDGSSVLLVIADQTREEIVQEVHQRSKTANLILSLDNIENNEFTPSRKFEGYLNNSVESREIKTTAVIVTTDSLKHLALLLRSLKNNFQKLWSPRSYLLVVVETKCDVAEFNEMFKIVWNYWILNAVILCSPNNTAPRNRSEIELYTFNPYSGDHSQQWETIIHETVEVFITPGNFNHSWYIFKRAYTDIKAFENCGDLYFDKTLNLDGYVIPISVPYPNIFHKTGNSAAAKWFTADRLVFKTLAKLLRFDFAEVRRKDSLEYGSLLGNGSYTGLMDDVYKGRSHFAPTIQSIKIYPGLEMTYPQDLIGTCIVSRNAGYRSRWTNFADEKGIWIGFGVGIICFTVILYLQNKPQGIMSAFLDAERLVIGNTIIHTSTLIKQRIILASVFLVVLVVDGAIRGRFISILTIVRPYRNIETLEEVERLGMNIYGPKQYQERFENPQLRKRYNSTVGPDECIGSLNRGDHPQRVCFIDCRYLAYHTANLLNIYKDASPIWRYHTAIVSALYWPMTNRYSFEVQKLIEAGIYQKWKSDTAREAEVEGWKLNRALVPPYVKPTELNDLLPIFVLLCIGLSAALIVFTWEMKKRQNLRWSRHRHRSSRKAELS